MRFPIFPKRKAYALSNGFFCIVFGFLLYTDQWWPGVLFLAGSTLALRQFLIGQRLNSFAILFLIGCICLLTLLLQIFSFSFPLLFILLGMYVISKECFQNRVFGSKREQFQEYKD